MVSQPTTQWWRAGGPSEPWVVDDLETYNTVPDIKLGQRQFVMVVEVNRRLEK